jgi:TolB protein
MKKITALSVTLLLALLLSLVNFVSAPAQAQENDLDTVLARAAAKSFLITLLRPELANTMDFYLLDSVDAAEIKNALADNPATSFDITDSDWISDVTYQVRAILQPGARPVSVYAGKYDGRWQIEGIDLPLGEAAGAATTAATIAAVPVAAPVAGNGGGQLVFQTQSGGDIYIMNADGTGLRYVTSGIDPQLSPDGTQIAFTRWEPRYELFVINTDATNERALTHGWRQIKSPTWSADGSTLTFSYQEGGRLDEEFFRINLMRAIMEGDNPTPPPEARDIEVENGVLSYRLPADAYWFLKQINVNTGEFNDLYTERHSYGPTGHPGDVNQIIFKSQNGVALQNVATNQSQPVSGDHRDHTPVISPDGTRVAVAYWQDGHWDIHTMNLDGSNRQRLTSTPLTVLAAKNQLTTAMIDGRERAIAPENPHWNNASPVWSPDGTQIAFLTDRTDRWELWIMNADGSNQRPMFPNNQLNGLSFNYAGVDERMLSWQ